MNRWEKFNEASLAEKEGFYSDIRYITDADYKHEKRVRKDLEIENLEEYHDLNVQKQYIIVRLCILYMFHTNH